MNIRNTSLWHYVCILCCVDNAITAFFMLCVPVHRWIYLHYTLIPKLKIAYEEARIYINIIASERMMGFLIKRRPDWPKLAFKYKHSQSLHSIRLLWKAQMSRRTFIIQPHVLPWLALLFLFTKKGLQNPNNTFPAFFLVVIVTDNAHFLLLLSIGPFLANLR